ncbi:GntR family transcriptional regulator [Streptomyces sp. NBC_01669]|uniref:GntR family transcriptional regulator n=1 Tax=Streptomyces sp. NBC_01669 TaxID=2975909 RepID=UPI00224FA32B|nr:GntR family transcriptional regulator [Streptomyces sp. NBC_01669]MCX4538227.1 GntR family transcriptional regulator [Streptomyces sp. NBC_01669]
MAETYSRPPTAQRAVLNELRRWLASGRLVPGDQIRQESVAAELGTSVIPVREALKTLQSEGQVEHIPHRGFFVARLERDELIELCDIRSALEAMAVRRGLPLIEDRIVDEMAQLISDMEESDARGDVAAMVEQDRRFHFLLYGACGLSLLLRIITSTWDQSDPYRAMFFNDEHQRSANHAEHKAILEAVRLRDAEAVIRLLDEHRLSPLRHFEST